MTRVTTVAAQHEHDSSHARPAKVMGFDQDQTTHRFSLYKDGGVIEVTVKDPADRSNRDAIRSHLRHIAALFADGNFDAPMLVHDSNDVPGTKVMARLKDRVLYRYVEIPAGGHIDIVTSDREAIDAIHQFLKFQITEHKTGDSTAVQLR
jgi:hypothetical protein